MCRRQEKKVRHVGEPGAIFRVGVHWRRRDGGGVAMAYSVLDMLGLSVYGASG